MKFDLYNIVYLFANAFCIEIIRRSMNVFFDEICCRKSVCIFFYFLYFSVTSSTYLIFDMPVICLSANLITITLIAFQYKGSIKKKILSSAFTYLCLFLSELVVGAITSYYSFPVFSEAEYHNVIGLMTAKLLCFMMVLSAGNFKFVKNDISVSNFEWIASISIPMGTIVLEIILIYSNSPSKWSIFISVIIIFILNIFVFYLYDKISENYQQKLRNTIIENEKMIYYNQCTTIMKSEQELRQFRHDINNQLEMMQILIEKRNMDELDKHIKNLIAERKKAEPICRTENMVIDGILNYKLGILQHSGVQIKTELEVPKQIFMDTVDMTLLLGNLLDNMIEAFNFPNENKVCSVHMKYSKNRFILRLANTYKNEILYENGRIVSSKSNPQEHGFGLRSVQNVVDKYDGYMDIQYENNIFAVNIILILPLNHNNEY